MERIQELTNACKISILTIAPWHDDSPQFGRVHLHRGIESRKPAKHPPSGKSEVSVRLHETWSTGHALSTWYQLVGRSSCQMDDEEQASWRQASMPAVTHNNIYSRQRNQRSV